MSNERSADSDPQPDRSYRDREYLHEQYVERRRSAASIAEECGVSPSTVNRWLQRLDIERADRYRDESWLRKQYLQECRDQDDIAAECGVATTTICHWLARHGITDGESFETAKCETCGERFRYYPSVRDGEYCSNECSNEPRKRRVSVVCKGCGEEYERWESHDTEYCSMSCWGEDVRTTDDWRQYYRGIWHRQRRRTLRRDRFECVVCGISQAEHERQFGQGLDVHHLVPVRRFVEHDLSPEDAHALRNLVSVCRTHHPDAGGVTVEPVSEEPTIQLEAMRDRFR